MVGQEHDLLVTVVAGDTALHALSERARHWLERTSLPGCELRAAGYVAIVHDPERIEVLVARATEAGLLVAR
jgi:hypothetical protein